MKKILFGLSLLSIVAAGMTGCGDDGKKPEKCLSDYTAHCEDGAVLFCKVENGALKGVVDRIESYSIRGMVMVCDANNNLVQDKTCRDGHFINYPDAPESIDVDGVAHVCNGNVAIAAETCDSNGYEAKCANGKYMTCEQNTPIYADSIKLGLYMFECREDGKLWPVSKCENDVFEESGMHYIFNVDDLFVCDGNVVSIASNIEGACVGNTRVYKDAEAGYVTQECVEGYVCVEYEKSDHLYSRCLKQENVTEGCGDGVTQKGSCDENTMVICSRRDPSKGKTLRIDCPEQNRICKTINDEYGVDCALTCGAENEVTDFGTCDEFNHLHYCDQTGKLLEADCTKNSLTCGFTGTFYDCH